MDHTDHIHALIYGYIHSPENYWNSNTRQLEKFLNRRNTILRKSGWDFDELVYNITKAAVHRCEKSAYTYYFSSFGSSGSHLLQHAFAQTTECHALGEIYIAPELIEQVNHLPIRERDVFMAAYHLSHSLHPSLLFKPVPIVNTAHKPTLQHFSSWTKVYKSILIVRNPVDLVLSRTFRKDEYRDYLGKFSDIDYLIENISRTKRFYKAALGFNYDARLRFEDLMDIDRHKEVADSLLGIMELEIPRDSILSSLENSLLQGNKTNKYIGCEWNIEHEFIDIATAELLELSTLLGYS